MSGASAPSLLGFHPHPHPHPHPHRYTHSRISHSDPSYHRSSPSSTTSNLYSHPSTGTSSHITNHEHSTSEAGTDSVSSSSKRPFPFAAGSQERDKRARSCDAGGSHSTWDGAAAGPSRSAGWAVREGEGGSNGTNGIDSHEQEPDVESEAQPDDEVRLSSCRLCPNSILSSFIVKLYICGRVAQPDTRRPAIYARFIPDGTTGDVAGTAYTDTGRAAIAVPALVVHLDIDDPDPVCTHAARPAAFVFGIWTGPPSSTLDARSD